MISFKVYFATHDFDGLHANRNGIDCGPLFMGSFLNADADVRTFTEGLLRAVCDLPHYEIIFSKHSGGQ